MTVTAPTLWTLGHSIRSAAELVETLHAYGIETLVDVRRFPGSRRHPQFSAEALGATLAEAGIEYLLWGEALGGRRRPRPDSPNTVWRNQSFQGYADYMDTPAFAVALDRLWALAGQRRTAIMCAELLWFRCHRALIADALKARGARVWHIFDAAAVTEHPYTSAARVVDGWLTYAPEGGTD